MSFTNDNAFTAGVPNTASKTKLIIPAGMNKSEKASTAVSSIDYWIVTNFYADVLEKTATFADVALEVRRIGGVFIEFASVAASSNARGVFEFNPYFIVPKNSDVRLQATASALATDVSGGIQGYLATILN